LQLTRSYKTTSYLLLTVISNILLLNYQVINRTLTYSRTHNFSLHFNIIPSKVPETLNKKLEIKTYLETESYKEWRKECLREGMQQTRMSHGKEMNTDT